MLDVFRPPAGVNFRVALGGLVVATGVILLPGVVIVDGVATADLCPGPVATFTDEGVPSVISVSSSRFWLPTLCPLVLTLTLGLPSPSSSARLPLKVRFLGIGVSRSVLSTGIGNGLEVKIGILEPLFRTTGLV